MFETTIKKALVVHGNTQRDLAEYVGITESAISLKIRLKRHLSADEFFKICKFLHFDPIELYQIYKTDLNKSDLTK